MGGIMQEDNAKGQENGIRRREMWKRICIMERVREIGDSGKSLRRTREG